MRLQLSHHILAISLTASILPLRTTAQDVTASSLITTAAQSAHLLRATFPNPSLALVPTPYYWWESGLSISSLLMYGITTGDKQYEDLCKNTLYNQATATNDFMMTGQATGNDDQTWWALAALTAAENNVASPAGAPSFLSLAQNVFEEQKGRWQGDTCGGGLKWKINEGDAGWTYRSTITNGLFFQLAARLAQMTGDTDTLDWAEKAYDWVAGVGLIDDQYNVYDGTDDSRGCTDVNHDQWSYNAGVFLYGAAVMAAHTGDSKWSDRTVGLLDAAQRNFVRDGALFEAKCEGDGSCNTDQVFFKGILARWLGSTATIRPDLAEVIAGMMTEAAAKAQSAVGPAQDVAAQFVGLETADAAARARGDTVATMGMIGASKSAVAVPRRKRRSVAGRLWW